MTIGHSSRSDAVYDTARFDEKQNNRPDATKFHRQIAEEYPDGITRIGFKLHMQFEERLFPGFAFGPPIELLSYLRAPNAHGGEKRTHPKSFWQQDPTFTSVSLVRMKPERFR